MQRTLCRGLRHRRHCQCVRWYTVFLWITSTVKHCSQLPTDLEVRENRKLRRSDKVWGFCWWSMKNGMHYQIEQLLLQYCFRQVAWWVILDYLDWIFVIYSVVLKFTCIYMFSPVIWAPLYLRSSWCYIYCKFFCLGLHLFLYFLVSWAW